MPVEFELPVARAIIRTPEACGLTIGQNHLWIAAHARSVGAVTANEGEFRRVEGLAVENWLAA